MILHKTLTYSELGTSFYLSYTPTLNTEEHNIKVLWLSTGALTKIHLTQDPVSSRVQDNIEISHEKKCNTIFV